MSAREELVAEITDVLNAAISESEYDTEWAESVVGCLLNAHPARLLRAMAEMSWLTDDAAEVDRLRSVLAVRDQEIAGLGELLAGLSHAVGQYIECDERPRPIELWSRMCAAQERAAVYLNTGEDVAPGGPE